MLGQVRLGQVRLGQVRLGQVKLGQVRLGQARLGQVRLGQVRLDQVRNVRRLFFERTNKNIFERTFKRTFLSLYIVQFVCSNTVLSKFDYFERTLIRKNEKNKKIFERTKFERKTRISKERYSIKRPRPCSYKFNIKKIVFA